MNNLKSEIDKYKDKIVKELKSGKDVTLKNTPTGLKVQAIRVNKIS